MRVVDAGVVVELQAGNLDPDVLGDQELAARHLIDSEVTHVLRGLVLLRALDPEQGSLAFADSDAHGPGDLLLPPAGHDDGSAGRPGPHLGRAG